MNKLLLYSILISITVLIVGNACSQQEKDSSSGQPDVEQQKSNRSLNFTRTVAFTEQKSANDTVAVIQAAVAESKIEQNEGLMNVTSLPADKGMLFIFDTQKPRSFWMANTPLSLDIIFVNDRKKIVRIHHSAQPYSQQKYPSGDPARFVVETNGGFCINHDIHEGMYVSF